MTSFSEVHDFDELVGEVTDGVDSGEYEVLEETDSQVLLDSDGDGATDVWLEDTDYDGTVDTVSIDDDGDSVSDTAVRDTDQNGFTDTILSGVAPDDPTAYSTMQVDDNEDGIADSEYTWDTATSEWVETDPSVDEGGIDPRFAPDDGLTEI